MRGRGSVVILRLAAVDFEMGSIPIVSDVAIRVESNRGGLKDGFNPAMIASSTRTIPHASSTLIIRNSCSAT